MDKIKCKTTREGKFLDVYRHNNDCEGVDDKCNSLSQGVEPSTTRVVFVEDGTLDLPEDSADSEKKVKYI